jgi:hypothetical protein
MGAVMGWRPTDVYRCTLAELVAAWEGFVSFHGSTPDEPDMTRAELDDLIRASKAMHG